MYVCSKNKLVVLRHKQIVVSKFTFIEIFKLYHESWYYTDGMDGPKGDHLQSSK